MSTGMPELGSKISLISKADIRYEGRLFTVDPQECTIALASVRSFGTEDRETQYPVAPQSQVYDYILFRGSDIKDIRVLNNVSLPNDPAIMQMSVPPTLGSAAPPQYQAQFTHPVVGQTTYPQYHPMAGFPGSVHAQLNKTSELSQQTSVELAPQQPTAGAIGSGVAHHSNQVKDQGSMLDLLGGGSQQNTSRSGTPAVAGHRKSPTADQGTQVGNVASGSGQQRDSRRGSNSNQPGAKPANRNRTNSRNRQRYPSGSNQNQQHPGTSHHNQGPPQHHQQQQQHHQQQQQTGPHHHHQTEGLQQQLYGENTLITSHHNQGPAQHHQQQQQTDPHHHYQTEGLQQQLYGQNYNRGGWRGRSRGRGRGFVPRNKNTLKFENDYDFEQANTEFEELRSQLAKTKIADGEPKVEEVVVGEVDKKDDSGNETGAGEPEVDDDLITGYDKTKSFFDNISCEAVERSKGRSQRTDWRTERKLNSETFGVASARRGNWRGRGNWRHNPHHQPMSYFPSWRAMRGNRGRPNNMGNLNQPRVNQPRLTQPSSSNVQQPAPTAAAK